MTLRPMAVMVTLKDGESLKLGIRSSNFKADGTRSTNDSHGWFKVDHFRLQRIDAEEITTEIDRIEAEDEWQGLTENDLQDGQFFDLQGRRFDFGPARQSGIFILRRPDGSVIKFAK
jgi:hypothetical protein